MDVSNLCRLLIVDDEPEIRELLLYNFRKRGFDVMAVSNGFSGLRSMEYFKPQLIILDIMMPIVNGITMCRELKNDSRYKHIPVYILSATNDDKMISSALAAGAEKFISKQVHMSQLINMVVEMKDKIQPTL